MPSEFCGCFREQALKLTVGTDSASIQHESGGAIGGSWFAFVASAFRLTDIGDCSDVSGSWYSFLLVPR